MNKKAALGDIILDNAVYLIFIVLNLVGMIYFIASYQGGASVWENYYVKEIVKIIDFAEPGDSVCLDVHKATEIAKSNNVRSFSEIFTLNNIENEFCVKLSKGRKTCFTYFNEIDITNIQLKLAEGVDRNKEHTLNILCFDFAQPQVTPQQVPEQESKLVGDIT